MIRTTLIATLLFVGFANAGRKVHAPHAHPRYAMAKLRLVGDDNAPPPPPPGVNPVGEVTPVPQSAQRRQAEEEDDMIGNIYINFFSDFYTGLASGRLTGLKAGKYAIQVRMLNETGEKSCENVKDEVFDPKKKMKAGMMETRDMEKGDKPFGKLGYVEVENENASVDIFKLTKWVPQEYTLKNGVVGLSLVVLKVEEDGMNMTKEIAACGLITIPCKDVLGHCNINKCGDSFLRELCPETCKICPDNCMDLATRRNYCNPSRRCNWWYSAKYCANRCDMCLSEKFFSPVKQMPAQPASG